MIWIRFNFLIWTSHLFQASVIIIVPVTLYCITLPAVLKMVIICKSLILKSRQLAPGMEGIFLKDCNAWFLLPGVKDLWWLYSVFQS